MNSKCEAPDGNNDDGLFFLMFFLMFFLVCFSQFLLLTQYNVTFYGCETKPSSASVNRIAIILFIIHLSQRGHLLLIRHYIITRFLIYFILQIGRTGQDKDKGACRNLIIIQITFVLLF